MKADGKAMSGYCENLVSGNKQMSALKIIISTTNRTQMSQQLARHFRLMKSIKMDMIATI